MAAHSNWAGAFPELVWQRKLSQGSEAKAAMPSKNQQYLCSTLSDAIGEQTALGCRFCGFQGQNGQECLQPCPKRRITFVDVLGSMELDEPRFRLVLLLTNVVIIHTVPHLRTEV